MAFTWHASRSVCCVPVYAMSRLPPAVSFHWYRSKTGLGSPPIHTLHDGGRANVDGRNGLSRNGLSCGGIRSWIVTGRAHRLHDATHVFHKSIIVLLWRWIEIWSLVSSVVGSTPLQISQSVRQLPQSSGPTATTRASVRIPATGTVEGARRSMANGEMVGSSSVLRCAWSRPQRGGGARPRARARRQKR